MDLVDLFQSFGFPMASVVALSWYLTKIQAEQRQDQKEQNQRMTEHLDNLMNTNRILLDSYKELSDAHAETVANIQEINSKLDNLTKSA